MDPKPIGAFITKGPQSWQVIQREADGRGEITVEGEWTGGRDFMPQVRVAREADQSAVPGCDWQDAAVVGERRWQAKLRVPTGGMYRIETRLEGPKNGDRIFHVFVGDLWVIAGQSNAVGYGYGTVYDPPTIGVSMMGADEGWRLATHPVFDPTGTKHPASRDGGWVNVSPWLAFARQIYERTGVPVGLIPTARGGSPLSDWDPEEPEGGYLYRNMCDMIDAAGGRIAGIVWYQGESDTGDEQLARTYPERFERFVRGVRGRYGERLPVITAQLNRVYSAPLIRSDWGVVKEAQRQLSHRLARLAVVPTVDAGLSDSIHTNAVSSVVLGERFALAALGMVYGHDVPWRAAEVAKVVYLGDAADGPAVRVEFRSVKGRLVALADLSADFEISDAEGIVPVRSGKVVAENVVELGLERPLALPATCSHAAGATATSSLRDELQRPALGFYEVPIEPASASGS